MNDKKLKMVRNKGKKMKGGERKWWKKWKEKMERRKDEGKVEIWKRLKIEEYIWEETMKKNWGWKGKLENKNGNENENEKKWWKIKREMRRKDDE